MFCFLVTGFACFADQGDLDLLKASQSKAVAVQYVWRLLRDAFIRTAQHSDDPILI